MDTNTVFVGHGGHVAQEMVSLWPEGLDGCISNFAFRRESALLHLGQGVAVLGQVWKRRCLPTGVRQLGEHSRVIELIEHFFFKKN